MHIVACASICVWSIRYIYLQFFCVYIYNLYFEMLLNQQMDRGKIAKKKFDPTAFGVTQAQGLQPHYRYMCKE